MADSNKKDAAASKPEPTKGAKTSSGSGRKQSKGAKSKPNASDAKSKVTSDTAKPLELKASDAVKSGDSDKTKAPPPANDKTASVSTDKSTQKAAGSTAVKPETSVDKPSKDKPAAKPESATKPDAAKPSASPTIEKPKDVVVEKRRGLAGGIIGGLLAATIGFVAARYIIPDGWPIKADTTEISASVAAQNASIKELSAKIDTLQSGLDAKTETVTTEELVSRVQVVEDILPATQADLLGSIKANADGLSETVERLSILEKRPIAEGTDPAVVAAIGAYEDEVKGLREEVQAQLVEMQGLIEQAEAARAAAEEQQAIAAAAEEKARQQQAFADVLAALDSGDAFVEQLSELGDIDIPEALSTQAEGGVPTLGSLQDSFPGFARAALDISVKETAGEGAGDRVGSFFQRQLGLRSLEPREGDDPDAVLSRVENAVTQADLAGAIETSQALPEGGKAALADWIGQAQIRLDALNAAEAVAAALTPN